MRDYSPKGLKKVSISQLWAPPEWPRPRPADPHPDARHTWTPEELTLLGMLPDPEVSRRTGKSLYGVRSRRYRLGIPAAGSLRN
jgi:hypothetical protein